MVLECGRLDIAEKHTLRNRLHGLTSYLGFMSAAVNENARQFCD